MGRVARPKPARLGEKLLQIRNNLGLSQTGMLKLLELDQRVYYSAISGYELGTREPPLPVLLQYARAAGVLVEVLIDDELDLPRKLSSSPKDKGVKRGSKAKMKPKRQ
jgi:transcriptional regulator with XRE-family HTH domain